MKIGKLRYALVDVDIVTLRYRVPASYQSRPSHPPSPAALKAALARAAAMAEGKAGWSSVLEGVVWCSYMVREPLSHSIYLMGRLRPPSQREAKLPAKALAKELGEGVKPADLVAKQVLLLRRYGVIPVIKKKRGGGGGGSVAYIKSADPTKGMFSGKPTNVFPVGEFVNGSLTLAVFFNASAVSESLLVRSLLGTLLLGDNDSIVIPKPVTLSTGTPELEAVKPPREGADVSTSFAFRWDDAVPLRGSYLIAKLPTNVRPRSFRGTVRVSREGFGVLVIPARWSGHVLKPSTVNARLTRRGAAAQIEVRGAPAYVVLPRGVVPQ